MFCTMIKFRQIMLLSLILVCLSMIVQAGESRKERNAVIVTKEIDAAWEAKLKEIGSLETPASTQHTVGQTVYDLASNTGIGRMTARSSPDHVHAVFMKRFPNATSIRYDTYNFYDAGLDLFFGETSVTEQAQTGWGRIHNGKNDEAIVALHMFQSNGSWLWQDAGQAGYLFSNMLSSGGNVFLGNYPGFAVNPATDEIWLTGCTDAGGSFTPDVFYYSSDYGATMTLMSFPSPTQNPTYAPNGPESWPIMNPANPAEVGFTVAEQDPNNPAGTADGALTWNVTTDNGATWNSTVIYDETQWFSGPNGDYMYLVQNFGQFVNMFSDDGTLHLAFNGYGLHASGGDTVAIFPIVYWNNVDNEFIELTDPAIGHNPVDSFATAITNGYPGNGIGNAYPNLATGPDGELVCMWQQVEIGGNGLPVIAPHASNGMPSGFYATDIWGAVSYNNGASWSEPFFVRGRPGMPDNYPVLVRELLIGADSIYADLMFFEDASGGMSVSDPGAEIAVGTWEFIRFGIPKGPTGIDIPFENLTDGFILKQNYPNPFNPATKIEYAIPRAEKVEIAIYNALGQKVKTLLSQQQEAGDHAIVWDATNDAGQKVGSGIYYYRLKAGAHEAVKKMALLR